MTTPTFASPLRRMALLAVSIATVACGRLDTPDAVPEPTPAPSASTHADKDTQPLALTPWPTPGGIEAESVQLLADDRFWPGADRLLAGKRGGLHLLDRDGTTLSLVPGSFGALDHRSGPASLLVAAIEADRQQAAILVLDAATQQWQTNRYLPRPDFRIEGLCLYRDTEDNDFLFLVGEEGRGEQWLVAHGIAPLEPRLVRRLSLPPQSEHCRVDDSTGQLYVNEENAGLWAYDAHPEAELARQPVDIVKPFGTLLRAAGMAAVPGGVLALDPTTASLHRYLHLEGRWQAAVPVALSGLDEPEQLSLRVRNQGLELLVQDEGGLHQGQLQWQPAAIAQPSSLPVIAARVETTPVPSLGDAADDPAIWIHPQDPTRSRVLGTDKQGGLLVWDLAGHPLQDLRVGRLNNVDLRPDFALGTERVDLAVATNRDHNSLHLFAIDRSSGVVRDIGQIPTSLQNIYGLCMMRDDGGTFHAFANDKDGRYVQYRLSAPDGRIAGELVRSFRVASQPEGCVADDRNQRLFVGEEDVAVWVVDTRADAAVELQQVIAVGGPLQDDIEGLALYHGAAASYLVISSQGNDSYVVLDAAPPYAVRGAFRVGPDPAAGIDGAAETDGLEVVAADLGGIWHKGMLVVQDGRNRMPEERQNYKYVPWADIAETLRLD